MANFLSTHHTELIIGGHRFEAFSDDSPPIDFEGHELWELTQGRDGANYYAHNGQLGGKVMVKLLPISRSASYCLKLLAGWERGDEDILQGTYGDPTHGFSLQLKDGVLWQCDPIVVPEKTFEVTFHFEQWVPEADGMNFNPAPRLDGSTG